MEALPYQSLVKASSKLSEVEFPDEIGSHNIDDATALLDRLIPVLDSAQSLVRQKFEVPVEYRSDYFSDHMDEVVHLRNLSRAFRHGCNVASFNGDSRSVARYGMATLQLANAVRHGGLIVDHLVAVAVTGIAINCLRAERDRYAGNVRQSIIESLFIFEEEWESFFDITQRDAEWENKSGYQDESGELPEDELFDTDSELSLEEQKELILLLKASAERPLSERHAMYAELDLHALALSRLLAVDLAIRSWNAAVGSYPRGLSQLSPELLPTIPRDPFTGSEFVYRANGGSFLLYSLGSDRTDRGGRFGTWAAVFSGGYDLCLDAEDYWTDGCAATAPQGVVRRLRARLGAWWRSEAQDDRNANEH